MANSRHENALTTLNVRTDRGGVVFAITIEGSSVAKAITGEVTVRGEDLRTLHALIGDAIAHQL